MTKQESTSLVLREAQVGRAFVQIIDTLVDDFDVIDLLTTLASRTVDIVGAAEAGILLAGPDRHLQLMAASSEPVQLLELYQLQNREGPCLDCYGTGDPVIAPDLRSDTRWPHFGPESVRAGFTSVCALPIRLRDAVLGCLNLFMAEPGGLSDSDIALAQALADVACIAILQNQTAREAEQREEQLQRALDSRVSIEQAKGMIAERAHVDMHEAFSRLRGYSRDNNLRLTDVAVGLVQGAVELDAVARAIRKSPSDR